MKQQSFLYQPDNARKQKFDSQATLVATYGIGIFHCTALSMKLEHDEKCWKTRFAKQKTKIILAASMQGSVHQFDVGACNRSV